MTLLGDPPRTLVRGSSQELLELAEFPELPDVPEFPELVLQATSAYGPVLV